MKRLILVFLFLLSLAVLIIFSISNMESVTLNIWPNQPLPLLGYEEVKYQSESSSEISITEPRGIPVFLLVFMSVGLGFVLACFFSIFLHLKDKKEIGKLKKIIRKNEKEIDSLRMIPIKEGTHDEENLDQNRQ